MKKFPIRLLTLLTGFVFIISANAQLVVDTYAPNMYPAANTPFIHGVTSGDPLPNAVIIWTRVDTNNINATISGEWFVATDSAFTNVVASGNYTADSTTDFTVNVDATGLSAGTVYFYRFSDGHNRYSEIGRTKTAAVGHLESLKMGVFSCSSLFSGYFNAYRLLAQYETFDAVIHLGDYIYDFVDEDEQVRIPSPYPEEPENLAEWRARHRFYLFDPDLRAARANHPWIALWDNHDRAGDTLDPVADRVFREYLPLRHTVNDDRDSIFREFKFGDLVDIFITDVGSFHNEDTFPNGERSMMGLAQLNWFTNGLKASTQTWKFMGSQKMMGGWYTTGIPPAFLNLVPNNGPVFDSSSWDGYSGTRSRIFDSLRENHINNFMVLSGDAHVSMAMDLVNNPYDSTVYNHITGEGAVGVEFLPASISRGNLDESGMSLSYEPIVETLEMNANPQHVYFEGTKHGWGLLEITPDSIRASIRYSPILSITDSVNIKTLVMKNGANHWDRSSTTAAMTTVDFIKASLPYPNPAHDHICMDFEDTPPSNLKMEIYSVSGQLVSSQANLSQHAKTSVAGLASGSYTLVISHNGNQKGYNFVVK